MFHLASSSASQLYYRTMLWSGTLYALIPLLFLSASATPSEAFRSLPRQIRYEKIHNYIQPHWETERYGIHEVPEELEGYFSITPSGEPWFSDLVQQTLFAACAVASDIPIPEQPGGFPYKTVEQRDKMEVCVLYAVGLLDREAVESKRPLEVLAREYGLTRGEEDGEPENPSAPSQFSVERLFDNVGRYFRPERRPGVPPIRRPIMRPVH